MKIFEANQESTDMAWNAYTYLANLIFGNDTQKKEEFLEVFKEKVGYIIFLDKEEKISGSDKTGGEVRKTGTKHLGVRVRKFIPGKKNLKNYHICIHEFCHVFQVLLPIYLKNKKEYTVGNIRYENSLGEIKKTDLSTNKEKYYGHLFLETITDLITGTALIMYNEDIRDYFYLDDDFWNENISIDDIFMKPTYEWTKMPSKYMFLVKLTQLMIKACSNTDLSYEDLIKQGKGIVNIEHRNLDGSFSKSNDLIYSTMCDVFHMMKEYDKIMGSGAYEQLLSLGDEIYIDWVENNCFYERKLTFFVEIIKEYIHKKIEYNKNNGIYSEERCNTLLENFNLLLYEIMNEYGLKLKIGNFTDAFNRLDQTKFTRYPNGKTVFKSK